jgi:hypothetical protein
MRSQQGHTRQGHDERRDRHNNPPSLLDLLDPAFQQNIHVPSQCDELALTRRIDSSRMLL